MEMVMPGPVEVMLRALGHSPSLDEFRQAHEPIHAITEATREASKVFGVPVVYMARDAWLGGLHASVEGLKAALCARAAQAASSSAPLRLVLVTEGMFEREKKKSGDWLAGCFLKEHDGFLSRVLAKLAASRLLIDHVDISEGNQEGRAWSQKRVQAMAHFEGGGVVNFVVFDDAAYGGKQKERTVATLNEWFSSAAAAVSHDKKPPRCFIDVILPAATPRAVGLIQARYQNCRLHVGSVMAGNCSAKYPEIPSLTFLSHKIPDEKSFPDEIRRFLLEHEACRALAVTPYMRASAPWRLLPPLVGLVDAAAETDA